MTGGIHARITDRRKQVQPVPHTIYQRGDGVIKLPEIVNTVEISGEVFEFSTLPDEKKREIAMQIQDTLMAIAGYKRRTA